MAEQTKKGITYPGGMSYEAMIMIMQLFKIVTLLIIIVFVLALALPYLMGIPFMRAIISVPYISAALSLERDVSLFVQNIIPIKFADVSIVRLVIIIVSVVIFAFFKDAQDRYRNILTKMEFKSEYDSLKRQMGLSDDAKILSPLREKLENPMQMRKKDREQLLKLFAETKRKLDSMGRDLAFLAIDVVDSTGMKENEEQAAIEYDFKAYKHFIEDKVRSNGAMKHAWTPDGVMICFRTVDDAVKCAREVIDGLKDFNENVKTVKTDFSVRCGINAGYVYYDESLPMEEMSDRVIDIAGHMQKHSMPNTISIAKPAVEPLESRSGFVPTPKKVDGYEVYISERRRVSRN
jgi:class 3 adenylate cyclase